MNKDIDVSSLKIDLYSDKSVRDFTADVAQKNGRFRGGSGGACGQGAAQVRA